MESKIFRIAVIGPTGAGKSQFCNFCLKDKTNKTYEVSNSLNSCTQDPFSTIPCERNNINIELIDSAGSSDSGDKDIENLKKSGVIVTTNDMKGYTIGSNITQN